MRLAGGTIPSSDARVVLPGIRATYMRDAELAAYKDADEQVQRYRREADNLNEREALGRWEGQALDESDVRRISSFLKSYRRESGERGSGW